MIAMAIANDPDVIIADEPTTALDVTIQAQVIDVLKRAQQETGAAIIMITHDLGIVAGTADRVVVMYAGRPVEKGSVDDIFYRPRMPYTIGLLGTVPRLDRSTHGEALPVLEGNPPSVVNLPPGCPFRARCPMAIELCATVEPDLMLTEDPAHTAACHRLPEVVNGELTHADIFGVPTLAESVLEGTPRERRPVVLKLTDLKRHYPLMKGAIYRRRVGTVRAVDGIDLELREGETLGLVGESGSGKTTTLLEILNMAKATDGTIELLGNDTSSLTRRDRKALRRNVQVVFQDPMAALDPRLPIFDIIAEPMGVYGYSKAEIETRVRDLLQLVGLEPAHADRYPQHFSGGQRQRVGIARALATDPHVLLCDEPTSALDPRTTDEILDLIAALKARLGLAVLVITHEMAVVKRICDAVTLLEEGRVVESGPVREVVGRFGGRLSEALLALPPHDPADGPRFVEVLDANPTRSAVTAAERHFGVDLPVVVGIVEPLAGTTFRRQRVAVPGGLAPDDLVGYLRAQGVDAALVEVGR